MRAILIFVVALVAGVSSGAGQARAHDLASRVAPGTVSMEENTCPNSQPASPFGVPAPGYRRRYNTIAHHFLDDEVGAGAVTPAMYAILDALLDEAVASLPKYSAKLGKEQAIAFAKSALNQIDCMLLRHGFVYPGRGLVQLLSDGLSPTMFYQADDLAALRDQQHNVRRARFIKARGSGPFYVVDCDIASFIYLAVAEVKHYPLHLVDIPSHGFVRWDVSRDVYIDYETMDGAVTDDAYYRRNWRIPDSFVGKGGILRSMSALEAFAYHDTTVGVAWSWRRNDDRMIESYLRSVSRDPTRVLALNNLAWYYAAYPDPGRRDGAKAIAYARRAVDLVPDGDDLDTLACAYAQSGDFVEARATETKAANTHYVPFGSAIADDMALFMAGKTCSDPKFGIDPKPFRPHQAPDRAATARELTSLH